MTTHHHGYNIILTTVGMVSGVGSMIPGEGLRVWILFGISVVSGLLYMAINGRLAYLAIKAWFSKNASEK